MDDILVVLIVSLCMPLLGVENGNEPSLAFMLIAQVLFFVAVFFLIRWGAPYLMNLSKKIFAQSSVIIVSLTLCLSMSYLADLIGLSSVIGAFSTGIAIGQTNVWKDVRYNIEAIGYAVFIPVFFISIGLEVTFDGLTKQLLFITVFTIIAIFSKLLGGFMGETGWLWKPKQPDGGLRNGVSRRDGVDYCPTWLSGTLGSWKALFLYYFSYPVHDLVVTIFTEIFYETTLFLEGLLPHIKVGRENSDKGTQGRRLIQWIHCNE